MNPSHSELAALLVALGRAGIELRPGASAPSALQYRPTTIAPDELEQMRTHRAALLALLLNGYAPTDEGAGYVCTERLGTADEQAAPTHPGAAAWLLAVGEAMAISCTMRNSEVG